MKNAMSAFMKNPVVLASHTHRLSDGTSPVIGKVVKWWQEKDKTLAEIEFADTPLGMEYYILYAGGYQKAFSIGFRSVKRSSQVIDGKSIVVHEEVEVYELSAVAVPANPEALTKAMQDQFVKSLQAIEKSIADKFADLKSFLKDEIEEQFDRLKLILIDNDNPNGCGGDPLGDPDIPPVEATKTGKLLCAIANAIQKTE
jgi:HK97 family phage prohead protease